VVDQPLGHLSVRIDEIVDHVPYQRRRCLSRVIVVSLAPLVIDPPNPTARFNLSGNLIETDCITILVPLVKDSGHHDGCAIRVATMSRPSK
jgi:hypothetical protein